MTLEPEDSPRDQQLRELLHAARGGDESALGNLLELLRPYLIAVSRNELDTDLQAKGGASDLVQQSFLEAHRDFKAFQGERPEQLIAWLRAILRSNIADFRRRFRQTGKRDISQELSIGSSSAAGLAEFLAADQDSPSEKARGEERDAELDRAIAQLPSDYRTAILLRHREHLTFEEIGERMNRSSEAARKCWARAVRSLQLALDGDGSAG